VGLPHALLTQVQLRPAPAELSCGHKVAYHAADQVRRFGPQALNPEKTRHPGGCCFFGESELVIDEVQYSEGKFFGRYQIDPACDGLGWQPEPVRRRARAAVER